MSQKLKYERWDKKRGLKGTTIYLDPAEKRLLKKVAKAADKSVHRYLLRLVQHDLQKHKPPSSIG